MYAHRINVVYCPINLSRYFPPNEKLPSSSLTLPYVHVEDEAFRLEIHMVRP